MLVVPYVVILVCFQICLFIYMKYRVRGRERKGELFSSFGSLSNGLCPGFQKSQFWIWLNPGSLNSYKGDRGLHAGSTSTAFPDPIRRGATTTQPGTLACNASNTGGNLPLCVMNLLTPGLLHGLKDKKYSQSYTCVG